MHDRNPLPLKGGVVCLLHNHFIGKIEIVIIGTVLLIIFSVWDFLRTRFSKKDKEKQAAERSLNMSSFDQDKIYTSKSLLQEMNEERAWKGESPLPAINPLRGGTSTIARKDKSWKNVPDFFAKLLKKK